MAEFSAESIRQISRLATNSLRIGTGNLIGVSGNLIGVSGNSGPDQVNGAQPGQGPRRRQDQRHPRRRRLQLPPGAQVAQAFACPHHGRDPQRHAPSDYRSGRPLHLKSGFFTDDYVRACLYRSFRRSAARRALKHSMSSALAQKRFPRLPCSTRPQRSHALKPRPCSSRSNIKP